MISIRDLAWAAGFLEGEGTFSSQGSPRVSAAQVQREPLERLEAMFGGRIVSRVIANSFKPESPIWVWTLRTQRSAEVMMTLWTFMSPRRRGQIEQALDVWRKARRQRYRGAAHCIRGHALVGGNASAVKGRGIRCRECTNSSKRRRRLEARDDFIFT